MEQDGQSDYNDRMMFEFSNLAANYSMHSTRSFHFEPAAVHSEEPIEQHIRRHCLTQQARGISAQTDDVPVTKRRSRTLVKGADSSACGEQGGTFLGMRRGFLCARRRTGGAAATPPRDNAPAACQQERSGGGAEQRAGVSDAEEAEASALPPLSPAEDSAAQRARLAGIPSVIRSGRGAPPAWSGRPALPRPPPTAAADRCRPEVALPPPPAAAAAATNPSAGGWLEPSAAAGRQGEGAGAEMNPGAESDPGAEAVPDAPVAAATQRFLVAPAEIAAAPAAGGGAGCAGCGRRLGLGAAVRYPPGGGGDALPPRVFPAASSRHLHPCRR
jgi:hypothetical protein